MRYLLIAFLFPLHAFATPAPESLLREASDLYMVAKLPYGEVTEPNLAKCLEKGNEAQQKLNELFNAYPDHTVSRSIDALRLKGKVKAAISQCEKIKKDSSKKPYEPKNRDHSANF
ncbi:hypothetical protein [Cellvibrio sp. QJXJ]|uniref:hypothetical protein n=1 Tax=Cellvibrio sp. QJXJ TaxID=2964606 RepID=UPI0021C2640E|nr:hypothetical protein [Cellvibrio sp. QJXJ]UUA74267.1 hypothetical protein NNX04_07450 [Cellvibrio sp. QJXJ]